jgi:hypothetical protein
MTKMWSKILFLILMSWNLAHAGDAVNIDPTFDLHEKSFRCRFASDARESLENFKPQDLSDFLSAGIKETDLALLEDLTKAEKSFLKEHRKLLKSLQGLNDPKSEIKQFFTDLCLGSETILKTSIKGIATTTNVLSLAIGFPARFLTNYYKGIKYGNSVAEPAMTSFDILGARRSTSLAFYLLFKSYKIAIGSFPWLAPFYVAPIVNTLVMKVCQQGDDLSLKDQKFCQNFIRTKQKVITAAALGVKWGAKFHKEKSDTKGPSWTLEVSDKNFCEYLNYLANAKTSKMKSHEMRELMVSNLNPGFLTAPSINVINTPEPKLKKAPLKQMLNLRNVIVSLAPTEEAFSQMQANGSWKRYLKVQDELGEKSKVFNKLYRLKDINECLKTKAKNNFSYANYQSLKQELSQLKQEGFQAQHLQIENQFKKLRPRSTKLKWELVTSNTLNSVQELLESSDIGNIIIVTHSVGDYKKLIDSSFNQYPSTFFGRIAPQLMSLSFFTCHSETIMKVYDLERKISETESFHQRRVLNFVKDNTVLDDHKSVAIKGFTDYLLKTDKKLDHVLHENILAQNFMHGTPTSTHSDHCSIEIPGDLPASGSLSLVLNRHFIGNLNRFERKRTFRFSCEILQDENTLLLQNSALLEHLKLREVPSRMILNGEEIGTKEWRSFFDKNGTYSSSKVFFLR